MAWDGFELVCIEPEPDSEFDDVRSIDRFGFLAPTLRNKSREYLWWLVERHDPAVFVRTDEGVRPARADVVGDRRLIRVADDLTPDDPLLGLPTCEDYRSERQAERAR